MTTATQTLTGGSPTTTTTPNGGGATTTTTPASGWWDSLKDNDVKGWVANKNFPDTDTAFKSFKNLESVFGAEKAGRTYMLPKDDNDEVGWRELSKRLGVPEKAEDYKLPLPEGVDDGFARAAAEQFQKAGVPPRAGKAIAEWWNNWVGEAVKTAEAADRAESSKQMEALQREWGQDFTTKRELAQRGYRAFAERFGLNDTAALERAESVLGAANLTKFFAGLGSLDAESQFTGSDRPAGFLNASASDAKKQIDQYQQDRIAGKYTNAQWDREIWPRIQELSKVMQRQMGA